MNRPEHHHPGNKLDPAMPGTTETYPGHADPGLSNKTANGRTEGQPDKFPQRPDVPVRKSKSDGPLPTILS
jgi:hypothetical protein